ncbi:MAG TPA: MBL fold metallo-hydrolase [Rubrivivax sp.]|nr:MBL fold metallo-hydrolase [Rubrivivax sp.]
MRGLPPYATALEHGIFAVDTGFHRDQFDAAYLLVDGGRAAFIDTGTNFAVPRLLGVLQAVGLEPEAVDWVIPTHVHLDHAGGVGLLLQHLPNAQVLVHPRGARHLVDPTRLWASATAVYGAEEMARSYGALQPVTADRVQPSSDGMSLQIAGRELLLIHTPGHARHHHCIWDATSRGWFTGDTFGLSYREFDTAQGAWIVPTSTPVQFDPQALVASVQRLLAMDPDCMYLTHFGPVRDVQRLGALLIGLVMEMVELGARSQHAPDRHQALKDGQLAIFSRSLAEIGCTLDSRRIAQVLAIDLELNAQGLAIWLDRPTNASRTDTA